MHKILMIIRREYLQAVRTKSFWIGTLLFPLLIGVIFGLQIVAAMVDPDRQKPLAIVDATQVLAEEVAAGLAEYELDDGTPEYLVEIVPIEGDLEQTRLPLERRVLDDELYGVLTIEDSIDADDSFALFRKNVGDFDQRWSL